MSIVEDLLAESQRLTEYADGFAQVMTADETTDVPFEGYPDSPSLAKRVGQYLSGTGYVLELDTTVGGTITKRNELVKWKTADGGDESWYRWDGSLSKVISAGYNLNTDGIGLGLWINVGDAALRSELPQINALAGNAVFADTTKFATGASLDGVLSDSTLLTLVGTTTKCRTEGFYSDSNSGAAEYKFLNAADSTAAGYIDGISRFQIRSLDVYACIDKGSGIIKAEQVGCIGDNVTDNQTYIDAASSIFDVCIFAKKDAVYRFTTTPTLSANFTSVFINRSSLTGKSPSQLKAIFFRRRFS